ASYILLHTNIPLTTDSFIQSGLNTRNLDYDYYLLVVDSCGNKTPISVVHQTMTLTITVGQLIHHLSWTPYKGFNVKDYIVQRFEQGAFVNLDTIAGNKTTDVIFPAPCNYNIYYRISAIDSFGHFALSDTVGKKALDTIPSNAPTFTNATVLDSAHVKLNFLGADSTDTYAYAVQRQTNGVWATAGKVLFTTKHAAMQYIDVVNTQHDEHCYTILTLDSCLNATPSDTFCTITLTGTPLDEANQLNWTPFKGYDLVNYQVQTNLNGTWGVLSTLPANDTALLHDSLHCYLPHYYRIFASEVSGGRNRVTYSDSIKVTPFDTIHPPPPILEYASVQPNGSAKLLWKYNTRSNVKYFQVWKSVNNGLFYHIATLTFDSTYFDQNVDAQNKASYYIVSVDSCSNLLFSKPSDTIVMMTMKLVSGFCKVGNQVSWTPYQSLQGGTDSFTILRSTNGGPFVKLISLDGNTFSYFDTMVTVYQKYTYRILASSAKSIFSIYSDTLSIKNLIYYPPNAANTLFATVVATGTTNGAVYLQWLPDNPARDTVARGYNIYEADSASTVYHLIQRIPNLAVTTYTQTGINTLTKVHK